MCDNCIKTNRPNECVVLTINGRKRKACSLCQKGRRKCSLVAAARASRTPSAPSRRGSTQPRKTRSKSRSASRSTAGPSRSSSRAAQSRVANTMCSFYFIFLLFKSTHLMINLIVASPAITIPPFKPLKPQPESQAAAIDFRPSIDLMQRDIQNLQQRLVNTERTLDRLVNGIQEQLRQDSGMVPAWLIPLLQPQAEMPVVPRVDETSGHIIGRTIYSPKSQKPKQVVSNHFMKQEDDEALNGE